ncbi:MAG: carbohydrate binding family 9 domain-containing protein [Caldisericaceae bacterium]|nr:carbohydrate binding family 9 domain-containing protein [Caldisericaceae bacterium]
MRRFYRLMILLFLFASFVSASDSFTRKNCRAYRVNPQAPKIDGKLNDNCWARVPFQDSFVQINPVENAAPSQKTDFKVLYDAHNIYFGIIAYDNEPEKIETQISRRDQIENSDFLAIFIDSYFDRRTAFVFGTNPSGVKFDLLMAEDGDRQDQSWDPIWEVKTSITDSSWIAEMRIPLSQLRFAKANSHTWGFQILRRIYRNQEEDMWQYIPKNAAGLVSYFGNLTGIEGIQSPKRIEFLPYSVSKLHTFQAEEGDPFTNGRDFRLDAGLDGKIGLTSDLTVDYTINPDFGQVEADPSEVNLSAFETFFEEKRPFFIEGKNIFEFPLAMGDGDMSKENLFYSRRIGRSPHYYPDEEDGFSYDYIDMPEQTRILGAAKLSGKTQKGWSIGLLDAVTNPEKATLDIEGRRQKVTVEPLTNYLVSRLQKDFNQGNTSIGGMVTATNRNIKDDHLKFLNRSAYTGGIDFRHQWDKKTYFLDFKLFGSHLIGDAEAIERVQTSSAHYFQRPDAKHVSLDTTRTTLSGHGGSFDIGKIGNGNWRFATGGLWRSPGLELNDLGFLRRADQIMHFIWIGYRLNNPVGVIRRANLNFNAWQGWNFAGDRLFQGGNINGGLQFTNLWGFYMGINREQSAYSPHMLRGGPLARYSGGWNFWFKSYSNRSKNFQIELSSRAHVNDDKISKRYGFNLELAQKISERLNVKINYFYSFNKENLQYVDTESFQNVDRYIFARIVQNTFGLVFRFNYSPTPNLSLQYYGQPFVSAGKYSHFKLITNPRAKGSARYKELNNKQIRYVAEDEIYEIDENQDGITDYCFDYPDFNFKEFRSNFVIRWEYRPGSTLFLVWAQNRNDFLSSGVFKAGTDFQRLFDTKPDNVFLIKLNYWLSI